MKSWAEAGRLRKFSSSVAPEMLMTEGCAAATPTQAAEPAAATIMDIRLSFMVISSFGPKLWNTVADTLCTRS
jgi:hypothetical protein